MARVRLRSANNKIIRILAGSVALAACAFINPGVARASDLFVATGGFAAHVPVQSFAERKRATVVRQKYDFSCGSAAIATLLTYHYGVHTSETDAFRAMWNVGDKNRIRKLGFSLLEMKRYLEGLGMKADGFRLTLDRVQEIGVPGVALIDVKGYRHFVVIKGVTDRTVLIGDPSKGLISRSRKDFEKHWDGVILFIRSDVARGKQGFNQLADWRLAPSAPFDRSLDQETLQSFTLNQTRPSFSGFSIDSVVETQ